MIINNLYQEILINPISEGANRLLIISGYATSAMAFHHLNFLSEINKPIKIDLIVGMSSSDGLSISNHRGFQQLVQKDYPDSFTCKYIVNSSAVHSKIYIWASDDKPIKAFLGSANYTQFAFSRRQREVLEVSDSAACYKYYQELLSDSINCTDPDAENLISIYNDKYFVKESGKQIRGAEEEQLSSPENRYKSLPSVTISFLDRTGKLPSRSGLNWGQRPEYRREPNQAYIRVPAEIYRTNFFPPIGTHFTVLTDDNKVLTCTRAQENGKAIETPHNNSMIGTYFRNRLGIAYGKIVALDDLAKYGRHDVTFYKIDDETYFMNFAVNTSE